jgi:hypothetical protein
VTEKAKDHAGRVKLEFRLETDEDGWPPADWEMVWAIRRGDGRFELDNIPFFAMDVAAGDVVGALADGDRLIFDRVLAEGGHSTIRVIMFELDEKDAVRQSLAQMGCETEGSHLPSLFAVDIPPGSDYRQVVTFLDTKAAEDVLEYQESAIRHTAA